MNDKLPQLRQQIKDIGSSIEKEIFDMMMSNNIALLSLRKLGLSNKVKFILHGNLKAETVGAVLIGNVHENGELAVLVVPDSAIDTDMQLFFLNDNATVDVSYGSDNRIRYMCSDNPGTTDVTDNREYALNDNMCIVKDEVVSPNDVLSSISEVLESAYDILGYNTESHKKEISVELLRFSELDISTKMKVVDRERDRVYKILTSFDKEIAKILDEFCELCHVVLEEPYEVDKTDFDYSAHVDENILYSDWRSNMKGDGSCCIPLKDLSGKLLYRFLYNDIIPKIQTKYKYFSKNKSRESNVFVNHDDCNLPFSGTIFDRHILKYLFDEYRRYGTGWMTYDQIIDCCLYDFFYSWSKFYEKSYNDKCIMEYLNDSDEMYFADGSNVPEFILEQLK